MDEGVLHKVGVTTRPLEQRLAEIRLDLAKHFCAVELKPLGTWAHRGNVELYFKHRYRRFQQPIGTLTEYFAFENVKAVVRDLRRMKPKELNEVERRILARNPSRTEGRELQPHEMLSQKAWRALCHLTNQNLDRRYGTWHELDNFRWEGEHRRLIEPTPVTTEYQPHLSAFGEVYRAAFMPFYQRYYQNVEAPV